MTQRRQFLGTVPIVIATVYGRTVMAQEPTISGCASIAPSGWRARTYGSVDAAEAPCATLPPVEPEP